jgi:hypothetical protein
MEVTGVKWIPFLTALLAILGLLIGDAALADEAGDPEDRVRRPLETHRCLVQGTFRCLLNEKVYSFSGAHCTEDCIVVNEDLYTCQLTNRCVWDAASGCFVKYVCIDVTALNSCWRWEQQSVCD